MAIDSNRIDGPAKEAGRDTGSIIDSLSLTGFSAICAWHFLILFSSLLDLDTGAVYGRPLVFQFALYCSLAVSYLVVTSFSKTLERKMREKGPSYWRRLTMAAGLAASCASAFMVLAKNSNFYVELCSWIVLGAFEAALMIPWLMLADIHEGARSHRTLVFNMGLGALLAFVVGNLLSPGDSIVFCLLPLASTLPSARLDGGKDGGTGEARPAPDASTAQDQSNRKLWSYLRYNAHFVCYGLVFGITQAVFSSAMGARGIAVYDVGTSWPIVGALLSTLLIAYMYPHSSRPKAISWVQRFSACVFISGISVSFYFISSIASLDSLVYEVGNTIGEMLVLAGFNTFDFGFMILAYSGVALMGRNLVRFIGLNRSSIYLSMGIGLVVGYALDISLAEIVPNHVTAILSILIILLALSTIPTFRNDTAQADSQERAEEPADPVETAAEAEETEESAQLKRQKRMEEIEKICHLSNRETQVFTMLANGMRANEIQQELWISIHTVKTHISNVYHKLDIHSAQELIDLVDSDTSLDHLKKTP